MNFIKNYKEVFIPQRHLLAIAAGIVGGSIPNNKSNINHLLFGAICSLLIVKIIYGDYDNGYTWSKIDILFIIITILEGIFGAYLINFLELRYIINIKQFI